MDHGLIPWQAILLTLFGVTLVLFLHETRRSYNAASARETEWDVRMAVILAGFFVFSTPFLLRYFPGMIARALAANGHTNLDMEQQAVDAIFSSNHTRNNSRGLEGPGIDRHSFRQSCPQSPRFLNSISTLITFDVYRKWIPTGRQRKTIGAGRVGRYGRVDAVLASAIRP